MLGSGGVGRIRGGIMKHVASAAVAVLLAFLVGCSKDNPVKQILPQAPRYLPSSTPLNTLEDMRRAYTNRDTTEYDALFDRDYNGSSIDQTAPGSPMLMFTWSDEARHINALARTTTITSITFSFPPNLSRFTDLSDPPGWGTVDASGLTLEISDGSTTLEVSRSETMQFKFRPTTPSPGSPTDTTWQIVRWTEINSQP